ncbi:hypothetical protein VTN02DRAFT_3913 [Thermoascus thermophilus]
MKGSTQVDQELILTFRPHAIPKAPEGPEGTRNRRDAFFVANKNSFLPLLPPDNYIEKLAELEEYNNAKLEGLSFLLYLMRNGVGGILGDDMGLGKTLQVLSLFQYLKENQHTKSGTAAPFLVVCPLSVLQSWVDEGKKWAPGLKFLKYHGLENARKKLRAVVADTLRSNGRKNGSSQDGMMSLIDRVNRESTPVDVVVTTYDMITADRDWFVRACVWRLVLTGDSTEVGINLPPKTQITLLVPLAKLQRYWYRRLLTGFDQSLLDEVLTESRKMDEQAGLQETRSQDFVKSVAQEWLEMVQSTDQSPDTDQSSLLKLSQTYRKLNNLLMQLRKCCVHPYLLETPDPEAHDNESHVIEASGKFVVLLKLIQDLVVGQNKKVLIFSGFDYALSCCEDLLDIASEDGSTFRHVRIDGTTPSARRNLNIYLFNTNPAYKVFLIATRAGGEGINLTSATEVVFLDQDWNPQMTLQAEARAHRIGQTKPVTVYKICSQGTVEEQMLGRLAKKLYLAAKVTEDMGSIHGAQCPISPGTYQASVDIGKVPDMGLGWLASLVRRGPQALSHGQIDPQEMLSWNWQTIVETCRDDRASTPDDQADCINEEVEKAWLRRLERVETSVFNGTRIDTSPRKGAASTKDDNVLDRASRRVGKTRTVMIDGFHVAKETLDCRMGEAVPIMAGKDPRLAEWKPPKKPEIIHQESSRYPSRTLQAVHLFPP